VAPSGLQDNLKAYLESSNLHKSVSLSLSKLVSHDKLPSNPFASLVSTLRLEEIKPSLFEDSTIEAKWLRSLLTGSVYGTYGVNGRRTPRKLSTPSSGNVISMSLAPLHEGSVYGLKHVMDVLDVVGVVCVVKCCKTLEKTMYPNGMKLTKNKDYTESVSLSIITPTTFHGMAFSSGELTDLVQNVDVTIQGSQFEKAVKIYSIRLMTELFAADLASGVCLDVKIHCKTASRKKGDPDTVKTFTPHSVRVHKNNFISAVKSSTVSHRSVTLECLMRTCHFKSDNSLPKGEVELGQGGVVNWKFIRVKRNYIMHYKDTGGTARSFSELPGMSLAVGYFLDPGGSEAAESYLQLFSSGALAAAAGRKKKVTRFVTEEMGKKETDAEATRKATEAVIGGDSKSPIWNYPLFDEIVESYAAQVKACVTRRNDFDAFSHCLPISILTGKQEALRAMWRMLGGAKLSDDGKTGRCSLASYVNRLRNDGQVLAECCRVMSDLMIALLKREKEFWNGKSDEGGKEAHKSSVLKTLANFREVLGVVHSMFWSWNSEILEVAAAGAGSDAAGLNDVFYSLLNDIGDVQERRMKLNEFPSYEVGKDPVRPAFGMYGKEAAEEETDTDSEATTEEDEEDGDGDEKKAASGPLQMPKLNETQCKAYSESLRSNMKVLKVLVGLLIALERCAGMDVASLCVENHLEAVKERLDKMKEGEGLMKKSSKAVTAADIEKANFFQKMQALNLVTGIGVLESLLQGPGINDIVVNGKASSSSKVAPGGSEGDKENQAAQNELMFSIRWTFDRQKMREIKTGLHGLIVDVEREAMMAAKSRNMYALPIAKEGVIMQYLVDARVDQALSHCFDSVLGGALVSNPFPKFVSELRSYAKRLAWTTNDSEVLSEVLGLVDADAEEVEEVFVDPYEDKGFDELLEMYEGAGGDDVGGVGVVGGKGWHIGGSDNERNLVQKVKKYPSVVADESSATMAVQIPGLGSKVVYGSKESLCLVMPDMVHHVISQLPTFTDNLRVPPPTSALSVTCGHNLRTLHFTEMGRLQGSYKLPTFLELQSDYVAEFAIAKQVAKVTQSFSNHVMELCESFHERSRHLFLGLAIGKGAYEFGWGRFKYNYASVSSKKERANIMNAVVHYLTGEVAIHALMLVPPLSDPGEMDSKEPLYVPAVIRLVCFRRGPGTGESTGLKKDSGLPSWISNSPGQQFLSVYDDLKAAMANGVCCGRTKSELGGGASDGNKHRMLFRKCRHDFVEHLKGEIEECTVKGDVLEAYDSYLKLCSFNLEKQHEIHLEDPEDPSNDPEYVPSLIMSLPGVSRMCGSVAGRLRRLKGLARGIAVLCDKGNASGVALPVTYPSIAPAVVSRINGKVLLDQVEYFNKEVERILTGEDCMCLDGACRSCLALLPKLAAAVMVVKVRISTGGKLFEDSDECGKLLADITGFLEAVKLVDAKDVFSQQVDLQRQFRDLDDNDEIH